MKRREALRNVAILMGGAITASTLTVLQQGCNPTKEKETGVFGEEQQNLFDTIADIIIPKTDSPGAKEAGVGALIVVMLEDCYKKEDREMVLRSLTALNERAKKELKSEFAKAPLDKQTALIAKVDEETYTFKKEERKDIHNGYRIIKELTLMGYFSSEAGATQALAYVQVPGRYEGCTTLKPGQKAWA